METENLDVINYKLEKFSKEQLIDILERFNINADSDDEEIAMIDVIKDEIRAGNVNKKELYEFVKDMSEQNYNSSSENEEGEEEGEFSSEGEEGESEGEWMEPEELRNILISLPIDDVKYILDEFDLDVPETKQAMIDLIISEYEDENIEPEDLDEILDELEVDPDAPNDLFSDDDEETEVKSPTLAGPKIDRESLKKMTVPELKNLLVSKNIKAASKLKKEDIIKLLVGDDTKDEVSTPVATSESSNLEKMNLNDLKKMAASLGLSTNGTKQKLIQEINNYNKVDNDDEVELEMPKLSNLSVSSTNLNSDGSLR